MTPDAEVFLRMAHEQISHGQSPETDREITNRPMREQVIRATKVAHTLFAADAEAITQDLYQFIS